MKTKNMLMAAAAAVVMATPAMANTSAQATAPVYHRQGPDAVITVYTNRDGTISKAEWMAFQSQKFDDISARHAGNTVYTDRFGAVSKGEWMSSQSQRFDELDNGHVGRISENEFLAGHDWMRENRLNRESTSR